MVASRPWFVLALLASLGMPAAAQADEPNHWTAGAAKASITPTKPVWMAGYASRNGPSEGVLTELTARSLVLNDGSGHRLAIVTMDLIEIPNALRDAIQDVALRNHGLKPEELLLNVSHTHGGPMLSAKTVADWGVGPEWGERAESYVREVVAKVDGILGKALAQAKPVSVSYSQARCGFAMNRRLQAGGSFRLGPNPYGPVDHDVPVLRVETPENRLLALVFGYACHNTALGDTRELHGDYTGFAIQKLEQNHPETVALFLAGCGGDQDPSPRRHLDDARQNGLALASAVEGALAAAPVPLPPPLSTSLEIVPLAFAPLPPRAELKARAESPDGFVARHARMILNTWPNASDQPADYRYPVQVVVFGKELTLVALGGEPVVDYALRLKRDLARKSRLVWVAGYSNLVNAYIPNRRVLSEGGYEGTQAVIYQSLPAPFRPELEERILGSVERQVKAAFGRSQPR